MSMNINWVTLGEIHPYEKNPRQNEDAVQYVANSIKEFGWKQPTVDESRQYLGKKWTVQARKNFMTALNHYSVGGTFSFKTMDELHFLLGKDEDEFVRLMAYPKAPELYAKRKEVLRKMRREEKNENGQRKAEKRD